MRLALTISSSSAVAMDFHSWPTVDLEVGATANADVALATLPVVLLTLSPPTLS